MISEILSPVSIEWNITKQCNLACTFCSACAKYIEQYDVGAGDILADKSITEIADNIARSGALYISLSGGEPLLHPRFFYIISQLKERKLKISISTNGTLIDSEILRRISDLGVSWVQISLAGSTRKENDKYMGRGAFDKVWRTINILSNFHGMGASVSFLQTADNRDDFASLCKQLDGTRLKVNRKKMRKVGRAIDSFKEEQFLIDEGEIQGCPLFLAIMENGDIKPCSEFPSAMGNALNTEISKMWPEINKLKASYSKKNVCAAEVCWRESQPQ
jgi:MoaA/NifB/PqqE/SkfB family radical SAM enzyme